MLAGQARAVRFGVFTLDLARCALFRGGEEVALRPKAFDVLRHLVEHAGEVVSEERLIEAVWPGVHVTDDSLVQCIKDIREALDDAGHLIVKTVPRRGYLFTPRLVPPAPAEPQTQAPPLREHSASASLGSMPSAEPVAAPPHMAASGNWRGALMAAALLVTLVAAGGWLTWERLRPAQPAQPTMMAMPSLAVLPFRSLSDEPAGSHAASALVDDITTEISRSPHAHMMVLRSAAGHRGGEADLRAVGRALGARYLVLGSTRPEGDALQVNVQLIEAESGRQLWAAPFHYAPGAVNRPVARIARSIGVKVIMVESQLPLPAKPEAGHYTILARSKVITEFDPAANKEALALYEKALDADPRCLPALLGLARAHVADLNNGWAPRRERPLRLDKAEDAVRRAIEIAPGNFAALQLRGQLLRARGNSEEAIAAFAYVLDLNSNFAAAHAELGRAKIDVGRPREAVEHIKKAIAISPSDPLLYLWYMWLGLAELDAGNNEAALQWLLKARQANRAYTTPLPWVAVAYLLLEREEEARARMAEYAQDIRKRGVPGLTIRAWREKRPPRDDAVGSQRRRIEDALRRLGVPEGGGAIETGSAR